MVKFPKISAAFKRNHTGEVAISLDGKIIASGKTSIIALKKAKKVIPDIEGKDFLISRIYPKFIAA